MSAASETDVLVVGGGPAGAVTALALARGGHSVWLVERGAHAEARINDPSRLLATRPFDMIAPPGTPRPPSMT